MSWKSDHIKKGGYTSYLNGKYHQFQGYEKVLEETNKHDATDLKTRLRKQGAIGGAFEYRFVPTSIGTSGTIICPSCQRKMKEELGDTSDNKSYGEYCKREKELIEKYDCEFEFQEIG